MKTILGFSSAALAGATTQNIAAAASTAMLNLWVTILYPFIWLFLTGWEPPAWEWGASKSLRRRSSGLGAHRVILLALIRNARKVLWFPANHVRTCRNGQGFRRRGADAASTVRRGGDRIETRFAAVQESAFGAKRTLA